MGRPRTTALIKGLTERKERRKPDTPGKKVLAMDDGVCVDKMRGLGTEAGGGLEEKRS